MNASTCTLGPIQTKRFKRSAHYRNKIIERVVLYCFKDKRGAYIKGHDGVVVATVIAPIVTPHPLPV